jgi:hypothetical protein
MTETVDSTLIVKCIDAILLDSWEFRETLDDILVGNAPLSGSDQNLVVLHARDLIAHHEFLIRSLTSSMTQLLDTIVEFDKLFLE